METKVEAVQIHFEKDMDCSAKVQPKLIIKTVLVPS
jgi:hypothetical protein